jgi:hypothetical protein
LEKATGGDDGEGQGGRRPLVPRRRNRQRRARRLQPTLRGTYDYAEQHDVRFTWLGLPHRKFESAQLGAREHGLGAARKEWNEGRRRWLGEMGRVLKPGGHAVLVAGDGIVADQFENAADAIADEAERARLVPVARASQGRPVRDRRLLEILGPHKRRSTSSSSRS